MGGTEAPPMAGVGGRPYAGGPTGAGDQTTERCRIVCGLPAAGAWCRSWRQPLLALACKFGLALGPAAPFFLLVLEE